MRSAPDWQDYEPASDWLIQSWEGRGTIPIFSWLIPRSVAERAGPWNELLLLNQDGDLRYAAARSARKIAFVEEAWGYYRSGLAGSISQRRSEEALRSLYEATRSASRRYWRTAIHRKPGGPSPDYGSSFSSPSIHACRILSGRQRNGSSSTGGCTVSPESSARSVPCAIFSGGNPRCVYRGPTSAAVFRN